MPAREARLVRPARLEHARAEATRRGVDVPGHVSVTGFDGNAESARTTPPLTTIAHDIVGKGRLAAEMVLANGPPRQVVVPVELVVRGSTGKPRA